MINLLPTQFKEELRQEETWKIVLILGMLFLIFLISLSLILFSIKIYLWSQLKSQKILLNLEEKTVMNPELQFLKKKVSFSNQNISKLKSFYQKEIPPSEILEKISQTLPSPVYLNTLSWNKKTSQIALSGFSPTRDILFQFKKNLEEEKQFSDINFPAQNWIKSRDINFNINFKLK